ncbi:hypothetical protein GCM10007862_04110 [Dyella lipolytica]|uniref:DUF1223 domain-containing protein n=1 Tax=Dyella lipolytica TaxID=1867835 RepID=A0ABW8IZH7_9GAMM|nr:DUF1223 domain-containing protein [Dyella lipolytica]GLQ45360.1 hypothetical protein GCM10007862_04110 [Dyella lipolytica]
MRRAFLNVLWVVLGSLSLSATVWAHDPSAPPTGKLVVVELFQSQGCSSCPPAESNINALAEGPGVLALSFGVTYWDELGWKDTFAMPAYTERQWNYAHYRGRETVWTPQVYVNGHTDLVGTDRTQLDEAIARATSDGPSIAWSDGKLVIHAARSPDAACDVWLVRYDPRTLHVAIGGGENGGRTLPQKNVVRELIHLGTWEGEERSFSIPPSSLSGLQTSALVQVHAGGDILSASIQNASPD